MDTKDRDHSALAASGAGPGTPPQEPIDLVAMRANLHATFNGGWQEPETIRAFHHGMDTVCNVLEAHRKSESTEGILWLTAPPVQRPGAALGLDEDTLKGFAAKVAVSARESLEASDRTWVYLPSFTEAVEREALFVLRAVLLHAAQQGRP